MWTHAGQQEMNRKRKKKKKKKKLLSLSLALLCSFILHVIYTHTGLHTFSLRPPADPLMCVTLYSPCCCRFLYIFLYLIITLCLFFNFNKPIHSFMSFWTVEHNLTDRSPLKAKLIRCISEDLTGVSDGAETLAFLKTTNKRVFVVIYRRLIRGGWCKWAATEQKHTLRWWWWSSVDEATFNAVTE